MFSDGYLLESGSHYRLWFGLALVPGEESSREWARLLPLAARRKKSLPARELRRSPHGAALHCERSRQPGSYNPVGREARREYEAHYTAANNHTLLMDIYDRALSEDNRRAMKLY